jgi:hypothetical protein
MLSPVRTPRKPIVRVLLAGLLDLAFFGSASTLTMFVEDATGSNALKGLALWMFSAPFVMWLAPKVSYRRRDALLGPYVFWIVAWRIAYLPYRDWSPRDDEMASAQYIRETDFAASWRPEYVGLWRLPETSDSKIAVDAV